MATQVIIRLGLIILGGTSSGLGTFQLISGKARPRVAAENMVSGLGTFLVGSGYGVPGAIGDALVYGGGAVLMGVGIMIVRRKRFDSHRTPPLLRE